MRKLIISLLALSCVGLFSVQGNMISNGDFEADAAGGGFSIPDKTKSLTDWSQWGGDAHATNYIGWYQNDLGDYTLKLWCGTEGGVYQDFSVTAGSEYSIQYETYTINLTDREEIGKIEWYSDAGGSQENKLGENEVSRLGSTDPNEQWETQSATLTAPASAVLGRIVFTGENFASPAGDIHYDDVNIVAVPEPISAALLGAGLGLIYLCRRKIQK